MFTQWCKVLEEKLSKSTVNPKVFHWDCSHFWFEENWGLDSALQQRLGRCILKDMNAVSSNLSDCERRIEPKKEGCKYIHLQPCL